jgi:hypothetical protein
MARGNALATRSGNAPVRGQAGQAQHPTGSPEPTAAPTLPFELASRQMSRFSFTTGTLTASAAAPLPVSPIQIPAVGYLSHLNLEVTVTGTGGATPAFTADAPFNILQAVELKTAAGNDIIAPYTGYQLYLADKYGCQYAQAPMSDNRLTRQYSATAPSAHFFLQVPLEIDARNGLGSVPALASNRSYQLALTLAAVSTVLTGAPGVTVTINGTAYYWSEPPAQTQNGVTQQTTPRGIGTLSQWQIEMPVVSPGDKYIKSNNVGNVLRTIIFTLRNAAGARIDTAGWPGVSEIYLDNEPMFYFTQNEWEDNMVKWYQFTAAAKDVAQGLDTGVYVIPFHALCGGVAGAQDNARSQLLPTLDASQLQIRGTAFGANVSTLEILTNSVIPVSAASLFGRS